MPSLLGICMQTEKQYKADLFNVNRVINRRRFSICEERGSKCSESVQLSPPTMLLPFGLSTQHPLSSATNPVWATQEMKHSLIFPLCLWRGISANCAGHEKHLHLWDLLPSERLKAEHKLLTICRLDSVKFEKGQQDWGGSLLSML